MAFAGPIFFFGILKHSAPLWIKFDCMSFDKQATWYLSFLLLWCAVSSSTKVSKPPYFAGIPFDPIM